MQTFGLTHGDFTVFLAHLLESHRVSVRVSLADLDGNVLTEIQPAATAGSVLHDLDQFGDVTGPTRRLTMDLLDPRNQLGLDASDPSEGALFADRRILVSYDVPVPALGRVVECPVFAGIPTKLQRGQAVVSIEADDVSRQGMGEAWSPYTIGRGALKVDAIARILSRSAGFTTTRLPASAARLPKAVSLARHSKPWVVAARIAESMDRVLYAAGDGVPTVRRLPDAPVFTFRPGLGGSLTQPVAATVTLDGFANTIEVLGRKQAAGRSRIRAVATAPRSHPLSPARLAQHGVPYRVVRTVENGHLRTPQAARRRAESLLGDTLRSRVEATYSVLPLPVFDVGDLVAVVTASGDVVEHRLRTWTLPLSTDGGDMAVGWAGRAPVRADRIRRPRPRATR